LVTGAAGFCRVPVQGGPQEALRALREDISVLGLESFVAVLTSVLTKQYRAAALIRLYELLDRLQPDVERTNRFVQLLDAHGLAA
jgi:hypothetical protein